MTMRNVRILLGDDLIAAIDKLAEAEDRSRNWKIRDLLRAAVEQQGGQAEYPVAAFSSALANMGGPASESPVKDVIEETIAGEPVSTHRHRRWEPTGTTRPGEGTNRGHREREIRCINCPEGRTKWEKIK